MLEADLTVAQLSKILQRSRSSIKTLIKSGKLKGYNASPGDVYEQWRVTPESLDEFRAGNAPVPPQQRRKRKTALPAKKYV